VTQQVKQTEGALGYVELIYAVSNKLPYAAVKNASGAFIEPSLASVTAAAEGANLGPDTDFRVSITNAPGAAAYPISSFTWLLVHKTANGAASDAARAAQIKAFCTWMIGSEAQAMASGLQYAPLPAPVVALVKARLAAM
jgi:phosphate transport system substrate-binding protein